MIRLGWPIAVVALALLLGGCGDDPADDAAPDGAPRTLTTAESERLSVARFNNYDRGRRTFSLTTSASGSEVVLEGVVDYRRHVLYARMETPETGETALVQATPEGLAAHPEVSTDSLPEPPRGTWSSRGLDETQSAIDTAILLLLNLGSDRPENALLLRQNGAQWWGESSIGGTAVDEFSGPGNDNASSPLRYFVDENGLLWRFAGTVKGEASLRIDFEDGTPEQFRVVKELRQSR